MVVGSNFKGSLSFCFFALPFFHFSFHHPPIANRFSLLFVFFVFSLPSIPSLSFSSTPLISTNLSPITTHFFCALSANPHRFFKHQTHKPKQKQTPIHFLASFAGVHVLCLVVIASAVLFVNVQSVSELPCKSRRSIWEPLQPQETRRITGLTCCA